MMDSLSWLFRRKVLEENLMRRKIVPKQKCPKIFQSIMAIFDLSKQCAVLYSLCSTIIVRPRLLMGCMMNGLLLVACSHSSSERLVPMYKGHKLRGEENDFSLWCNSMDHSPSPDFRKHINLWFTRWGNSSYLHFNVSYYNYFLEQL